MSNKSSPQTPMVGSTFPAHDSADGSQHQQQQQQQQQQGLSNCPQPHQSSTTMPHVEGTAPILLDPPPTPNAKRASTASMPAPIGTRSASNATSVMSPSSLRASLPLPSPGVNGVQEAYFREQRMLSSKMEDKSKAFRMFFKLPQTERLIDDFSCAVKGKILLHGRLYISQNYVCFYSNIFGHKTKIVIEYNDILAIKKRRLAKVIPNAIEIITSKKKFFFASFMFRNQVHKMLTELWTIHLKLAGKDPLQFIEKDDSHGSPHSSKKSERDDDEEDSGKDDDEEEEEEDEDEDAAGVIVAQETDAEAAVQNATNRQLIDEWDDGVEMDEVVDENGTAVADQDAADVTEKDLPPEMLFFTAEHEVNYKEILNSEYSVPLRKFFDICLADSSTCTHDYHVRRGDSEIQISPWQSFGPKFGSLRDIRFRSPVKIPFGPKSTRMFFNQRYRWLDKKHLYVELSGYSADVPYGDSFRIESKWDFKETEDRHTSLTIQLGVRFIKSTLWKGRITDGVFKETTVSYQQWIDVAQGLVDKERESRTAKRGSTPSVASRVSASSGKSAVSATAPANVRTSASSGSVASASSGDSSPGVPEVSTTPSAPSTAPQQKKQTPVTASTSPSSARSTTPALAPAPAPAPVSASASARAPSDATQPVAATTESSLVSQVIGTVKSVGSTVKSVGTSNEMRYVWYGLFAMLLVWILFSLSYRLFPVRGNPVMPESVGDSDAWSSDIAARPSLAKNSLNVLLKQQQRAAEKILQQFESVASSVRSQNPASSDSMRLVLSELHDYFDVQQDIEHSLVEYFVSPVVSSIGFTGWIWWLVQILFVCAGVAFSGYYTYNLVMGSN